MSAAEQNNNLESIAGQQAKLEKARTAADSPETLKARLAEYKATYITELNQGQADLQRSASSFKTKEAQQYLKSSATNLNTEITHLADEGQKLYDSGRFKAPTQNPDQSLAKTSTEPKPDYPNLATLKNNLASELGTERTNLEAIRQLEVNNIVLDSQIEANEKTDQSSRAANLSSTISNKQNTLKSLEAISKNISAIDTQGTSSVIKNNLEQKISQLKSDLATDLDIAQNLLKGQVELKKQNAEIAILDQQINKNKGQLSSPDYEKYLSSLKSKSTDLNNIYDQAGPGYINNLQVPFLKNLKSDFYSSNYQPVSDKLQNLYAKLELKHPIGPAVENPEKQANLDAVAAKAEFAKQNAALSAVEKQMSAEAKDPRQNLDRDNYEKLQKQLIEISTQLEKIVNTYRLAELASDSDSTISTVAKELYDQQYISSLDRVNKLLDQSRDRESKVDAAETKAINEQITKTLGTLDQNWQATINNQKQFLAQPDNLDENSPEFKLHQQAENKIFNFLVTTESQANSFLSKDYAKNGLTPENQRRAEEYRTLSKQYLDQITANRAYRNIQKAAQSEQGQSHLYQIKIGTKEVMAPEGDNDFRGKSGGVKQQVDVFEDRYENYKFLDCVEFLDPNSPDYKAINAGRGWKFKQENLPQDVQDRMSIQADNLITDQKKSVEEQFFKDKNKVLTDNKLFDEKRDQMGEKGQSYFAAIEAMSKGDAENGLKLYQQYLSVESTLSETEKKLHQPYLIDAKRQVEVLSNSTEFYKAVKLQSEGKLDDSLPGLREYIKKIQNLEPRSERQKYAEQLTYAVETLGRVNNAKVEMLADLNKDLRYLSVMHTIKSMSGGKIDAKNFAALEGEPRILMIPYVSPDLLTDGDRKLLDEGRAGLRGEETTEMDNAINDLKTRIQNGEPINFEEEYGKIKDKMSKYSSPELSPGAATYRAKDGSLKVDTPSAHLDELFDNINSTDSKVREKGFVKIADYFSEEETGMHYSQKYLNKAMFYRYKDFEKVDNDVTKKAVEQKMLADPAIAADLIKGATEAYKKWAEETNAKLPQSAQKISINPPDALTFQQFQKQIFTQKFQVQYEREMRLKMTEQAKVQEDAALKKFYKESAGTDRKWNKLSNAEKAQYFEEGSIGESLMSGTLGRFNQSLPYNDGSGRWYKPWSWSDYNEDEWNDFQDKTREFAIQTLVTLPIGWGAAKVGQNTAKALLSLFSEGLSKTAITTLEQGGIRALMSNPALYEGLSPALKLSLRAKVGVAWSAGLVSEGTSMMVMNSVWEGVSSGHNPEVFEYLDKQKWSDAGLNFLENVAKAGVFRVIGAAQAGAEKSIAGQAESSFARRAAGKIAGENTSGGLGAALEEVEKYRKTGKHMSAEEVAESMAKNAVNSMGSAAGHGRIEKKSKISNKEKAKYTQAEKEFNQARERSKSKLNEPKPEPTQPDIRNLEATPSHKNAPPPLSGIRDVVNAVRTKPTEPIAREDFGAPEPVRNNDPSLSIEQVPRNTEIIAIGDQHGNGEIYVANLQSAHLIGEHANFSNPDSVNWTGGNRKVVFHGDIIGDRGTNGLGIMASIRKLQAQARAAGGDIEVIGGNHEDIGISFITGKKLPKGAPDAFSMSIDAKEQGKGILEFINKFSSDPRYREAKSLEDLAELAGLKIETLAGHRIIIDPKFPEFLANMQKDILSNMRGSPEGRVILDQLASLKLAVCHDDTIFFHTDPTQAMIDLINQNGKTVGEGVDSINKKYQQGLRYLLTGEGSLPPDFQAISDAFMDTNNRTGDKGYATVKLDTLPGINRIIHGHTDHTGKDFNASFNKDGKQIISVDRSAGKGGKKMNERSIAVIDTKGKMTVGVDAEAHINSIDQDKATVPNTPESQNSWKETHFKSQFDNKIPAKFANAEGWIDQAGRVHINVEMLSKRVDLLHPEYSFAKNSKGEVIIKGPVTSKNPTGEYSLKSYESAIRGTTFEGRLLNHLTVIKNHENTHLTLEFIFTVPGVDSNGQPARLENAALTGPLKDLFATPDANGNVPEGKIPLVDHEGKPVQVTWENVQEYLCHVGDGSQAATPEFIQKIEKLVSAKMPAARNGQPTEFTFQKARQAATKLLASNPVEAFARQNEAAKSVPASDAVWKKLNTSENPSDPLANLSAVLADSNSPLATHAQELVQDFISVIRSGDKNTIDSFIDQHAFEMSADVYREFQNFYNREFNRLSAEMLTPEGLARVYKAAETDPLKSLIARQLIKERLAIETSILSRPPKIDQLKSDLASHRIETTDMAIGIIKRNIQVLSASPEGIAFLLDLPNSIAILGDSPKGRQIVRDQIKEGNIKVENLPAAVRENLINDLHQQLTDQLGYIENSQLRELYSQDFTPEKLTAALERLRQDPNILKNPSLISPEAILLSGGQGLPTEAIVKLIRGDYEYKPVLAFENGQRSSKTALTIVGKSIGEKGGFGEVYLSFTYDSVSGQPKEGVAKKLLSTASIEKISGYKNLDEAGKAKVRNIIENIPFDGIDPAPLEKARTELSEVLGPASSSDKTKTSQLEQILENQYYSYLEARNSTIVMSLQAQGKLKNFMGVKYVSSDGKTLIFENLAIDNKVQSYKNILSGATPVEPKLFWRGIADVIASLREAHSVGLLHMDIKPHNIIIGPDGRAKIIDYGTMLTTGANDSDTAKVRFKADEMSPEMLEQFKESPMPYQASVGARGKVLPSSDAYRDMHQTYAEFKRNQPRGTTDNVGLAKSLERDLFGSDCPPEVRARYLVPPELIQHAEDFANGKITADQFENMINSIYK